MKSPRLASSLPLLILLAACSGTEGSPGRAQFQVDVAGERFTLVLTDPDTIREARENLQGRNTRFPIGPLRTGNGGFNGAWTWHLDPAETRMTEAAIEVCDGRPSYVEAHQGDYPSYCPWGARIVGETR